MRRVPLLAILAALVSLLAVPARAATAEGILLRGSKSAYVDLYVYVNRTISVADVTMKTKGSYVGFFLAPAPANRDNVGALVMPRVGANGGDTTGVIKLGDTWDVQAGKYRMFLLTDGAAEVFVPIEGQGFRGWNPRGRAPFSVRRADFAVSAGSGGESRSVPLALKSRSLVVAAGQSTSRSLTAIEHVSACVTVADTCAGAVPAVEGAPLSSTRASGAQLVAPGSYNAMVDLNRLGGVDAGSYVDGVVMVLTIGRQT